MNHKAEVLRLLSDNDNSDFTSSMIYHSIGVMDEIKFNKMIDDYFFKNNSPFYNDNCFDFNQRFYDLHRMLRVGEVLKNGHEDMLLYTILKKTDLIFDVIKEYVQETKGSKFYKKEIL